MPSSRRSEGKPCLTAGCNGVAQRSGICAACRSRYNRESNPARNSRRYQDIALRERPGPPRIGRKRNGPSFADVWRWRERVGVRWLKELRDPRRVRDGDGFVYVCVVGAWTKIGETVDVASRMRALRAEHGAAPIVLASKRVAKRLSAEAELRDLLGPPDRGRDYYSGLERAPLAVAALRAVGSV